MNRTIPNIGIPTSIPPIASPIATATLLPTNVITPTLVVLNDYPIPIGKVANDDLHAYYANFPIGEHFFGGIRFLIAREPNKISSSQCAEFKAHPEWPTDFVISTGYIESPHEVYLLINSAYSAGFFGKEVGEIEMQFSDGQKWLQKLVIGENIREWRVAADEIDREDAQVSSCNSEMVYSDVSMKGDIGVLDMLKMEVPQKYRDGTLSSIVIRDTVPDVPCLFVAGITIKAP